MPGDFLGKPHVGKEIPHPDVWKELLKSWKDVLNAYLKNEIGSDIPQWHMERSHTGFLAAAVWKMGGVALEEYATERYRNEPRKRAEDSQSGRCDLYFSVESLDCLIEAKHDWVEGLKDSLEKMPNKIEAKFKAARDQLQSLPAKERKKVECLSLCWITPELKRDREIKDKILKNVADYFVNSNSIVAIYHVPSNERKGPEEEYEKGKTYPGIVLVGRRERF